MQPVPIGLKYVVTLVIGFMAGPACHIVCIARLVVHVVADRVQLAGRVKVLFLATPAGNSGSPSRACLALARP